MGVARGGRGQLCGLDGRAASGGELLGTELAQRRPSVVCASTRDATAPSVSVTVSTRQKLSLFHSTLDFCAPSSRPPPAALRCSGATSRQAVLPQACARRARPGTGRGGGGRRRARACGPRRTPAAGGRGRRHRGHPGAHATRPRAPRLRRGRRGCGRPRGGGRGRARAARPGPARPAHARARRPRDDPTAAGRVPGQGRRLLRHLGDLHDLGCPRRRRHGVHRPRGSRPASVAEHLRRVARAGAGAARFRRTRSGGSTTPPT